MRSSAWRRSTSGSGQSGLFAQEAPGVGEGSLGLGRDAQDAPLDIAVEQGVAEVGDAARASAQRLSSTALMAAASEGRLGRGERLGRAAQRLRRFTGAVGGMMPVPSLIGWVAAAGGNGGLGREGVGVAVDPPLGTRRMPVSGVPLAGWSLALATQNGDAALWAWAIAPRSTQRARGGGRESFSHQES